MESWFKNSAKITAGLIAVLFVSIFLGVASPENSAIYNVGIGLIGATMCVSPFVMLSTLVSGFALLSSRFTESNSGTIKRKRKRGLYDDELDDDYRMRRIMAQLTPPDRDYLRERLANSELGLSDDGELVSLDEVLSDYDDSSKSKKYYNS